jgi:hypothetical protein
MILLVAVAIFGSQPKVTRNHATGLIYKNARDIDENDAPEFSLKANPERPSNCRSVWPTRIGITDIDRNLLLRAQLY